VDYHFEILFITRLFLMPVVERFMRVFFDRRRTRLRVAALSYLAFPAVLTALSALLTFLDGRLPALAVILDVAPSVALLYAIALNYEGTWKKRLAAAVSIIAIGLALNFMAAILYGAYFTRVGVIPPRQSDVHFLLEMTAALLLSLTTALLLQSFKSVRNNAAVLPAAWVSILAIPLSSIVVVYTVGIASGIPAPAQVLAICVLFGINVLVFYLHDRLSAAHARELRSALHAREREYYLEQCRMMEESLDRTRAARHDMMAHFAALRGIAAKNGDGEAAAYLDKLLAGPGEAAPYSDTGNVVFDSVINFKLRNAKRENIRTDVRLRIPPALDVEASDVAAILGNLLDNALDAVARVEEKAIKLRVEYSREALFILVENTFDGAVKYEREGGERQNRLATRKPGGDHGHGLRNIRRAMKKYDGHMGIEIKGNVFSATVFLYAGGG